MGIMAAIKTGTDPLAPLPRATFHRTLEEQIYCPKCEAAYSLVVDYDWAVSHFFERESRRHLAMLKKAVMMGHSVDHRATHLECNGVVVTSHQPEPPPAVVPVARLKPLTKLIN
jgi:hypothetical protein